MVVLALATLLCIPSLFTGRLADDYIHAHILSGSRALSGYHLPWWRLFQFAAPQTNQALFADGILPWWADDKLQLSFFRPLTALTHWFDYALWPNSAFLMHLHNLLWALLSLLAIGALYNTLLAPRWEATLALALFAFEPARGISVAWIANRNALIASALSIWAVVLYLRGRKGSRWSRWGSPAFFALSLLAGEGAMGGVAYLVAGAVFLDKATPKKRALSLFPHAVVGVACTVISRAFGYGVFRSGEYLDPINDTWGFLTALPERSLVAVFAALGGPRADWWNGYELIIPGLSTVFVIGALLGVAYCGWLLRPVILRSPVARFSLVGALLSLLPAAATFPSDRVLNWISIGVMALFSEYLATYINGEEQRGVAATVGAGGIVLVHLLFAPLSLPQQCWTVAQVSSLLENADSALPVTPDIRHRTVIYVNPPQDTFTGFVPATRAMKGIAWPQTQRWLATGLTEIEVKRIDPRTVDVRPQAGFLHEHTERVVRSKRYPLSVGDVVRLPGMTVEILEVTADRRPARARFVFTYPLEDPRYLWLVWRMGGYVPFTPPTVGSSVVIPKLDFVSVLMGTDKPIPRIFARLRALQLP
jgi:hypothetical protein